MLMISLVLSCDHKKLELLENYKLVKMKILIAIIAIMFFNMSLTSAVESGATVVGPSEPGTLVKGPSSRATVKGPSGPIIITAGDTGAVSSGAKRGGVVSATGQTPGVIASTLPIRTVPTPIESIALPEPVAPVAIPYNQGPSYAYAQPYIVPEDAIPVHTGYY